MWGATCDHCREQFEMMDGWTATSDKSFIKDELDDSDWCMTEDEKTYCPNCHFSGWDDDGNHLLAFRKNEDGSTDFLGKII